MTSQEIYIERYSWNIHIFYDVCRRDADYICGSLVQMGCTGKAVKDAREHFLRGGENTGLTYSNMMARESIVAIGRATSCKELVNTIAHELFHVVTHICETDGIDMTTEEPCYIMGWLFQSIIIN